MFSGLFSGGRKKCLLSHPKINVNMLCVFERKFVEAHTLPLPNELPTSSNNFSMKASLPYIFEHWSPHISLENTDPLYGPQSLLWGNCNFLGQTGRYHAIKVQRHIDLSARGSWDGERVTDPQLSTVHATPAQSQYMTSYWSCRWIIRTTKYVWVTINFSCLCLDNTDLRFCSRLNVYVNPKFICWSLTSSMLESGKDCGSGDEIGTLMKETTDSAFTPSAKGRYGGKIVICEAGSKPS